MIAIVVQVPFSNGVPDLELPPSLEFIREDRYVHLTWGDDRAMTLMFLGTPLNQDPVFIGMMTPRVALALNHLGARVMRLRDAWEFPARRTWLMNRGIQEINGSPVIPHVIAGSVGGVDADEVVLP